MDDDEYYEIRVDGCCEAGSNSLSELLNYWEQYKGDGERVELIAIRTVKVQDNPGFDRAAWVKRAMGRG